MIVRSRNARSCDTITAPPVSSSRRNSLEAFEAGEVEIVRGLVEQEHVEAGEHDRGEARPRRLPARERRHLEVEHAARRGRGRRTPRRPGRRSRPRRARDSARARRRRRRRRPARCSASAADARVERALGRRDAGAAGEVRAHGLARAPFGLLGEVADGRGRRRERDACPSRARRGRRGSCSSVDLPVPLGATTPTRCCGPIGARHAVEHDARPERLGEVTGDEGSERTKTETRRHLRSSGGREARKAAGSRHRRRG